MLITEQNELLARAQTALFFISPASKRGGGGRLLATPPSPVVGPDWLSGGHPTAARRLVEDRRVAPPQTPPSPPWTTFCACALVIPLIRQNGRQTPYWTGGVVTSRGALPSCRGHGLAEWQSPHPLHADWSRATVWLLPELRLLHTGRPSAHAPSSFLPFAKTGDKPPNWPGGVVTSLGPAPGTGS